MPFEMDSTISIHAPREGGDGAASVRPAEIYDFNPRPPRGGRLKGLKQKTNNLIISIHAPREGGDRPSVRSSQDRGHFNPRPPRGGRHRDRQMWVEQRVFQSTPPARGATVCSGTCSMTARFQSTPPARGATVAAPTAASRHRISIHAPREGGDAAVNISSGVLLRIFQSTPPARGATTAFGERRGRFGISIHAPREGGDETCQCEPWAIVISIHAPREGGDCWGTRPRRWNPCYFNPRPPRGGRLRRRRHRLSF